ncbi:PREDICTED: cytochrome P450 4V2-like [Polistes canadensis]|uniref:cytochrome P450 4V2-like n=1 Tax=Polistes canadensis TaxID=91411 RepID=UPI000718D444|nr:PREDICTED: cytochrome P450 4V2-like [Polistes canadensis]
MRPPHLLFNEFVLQLDITNKLINLSGIYSSPWVLWVGPKLIVVCDDPENIEILSKSSNRYEKSSLYDFLKDFLGNGLISAPASIWKIHRDILDPLFKERMLSTYMDSIEKNSNRLANILETTNGEKVDFLHYAHLCTLDIIYGGLLESDLNLQSNPDCKLIKYIILDIALQRMMKFWLHPSIIFNNSSMGKWLQENLSHFNKVTNEIIKKKKESMNEDNFTREGKGPHARKDTSPILDAIFKSFYETGEYSETDIRDEINTMAFAGSDTAAKTLTFLFSMLATFPDIQEKVYEELYDMYGSSDSVDVPVTMEDTKKMNYLDRVIRETLRLFPPVPIFARTLCSDIRGQIFAMIEMKAIIAVILRKFIVQIDKPVPVENVNLKIGITAQLGEPIFLRFNKR